MDRKDIPIPPGGFVLPDIKPEPLPEPPKDGQDRFCPVSLGDWLSACERAGAPYVGARKIAEIAREDYLRFDENEESARRLADAMKKIRSQTAENMMTRLDCCADIDIKLHLSDGKPGWRAEFGEIAPGDPRAFDIVLEYPRPVVPVWQRPWIQANLIENYPEEYRVFVFDGRIAGISSYYPQRPLPRIDRSIEMVTSVAERLIEVIETPMLWHLRPALQSESGADYTCDFIIDRAGRALFLEGGPSHLAGAHPCCFEYGADIEGIALTDRNEARG